MQDHSGNLLVGIHRHEVDVWMLTPKHPENLIGERPFDLLIFNSLDNVDPRSLTGGIDCRDLHHD